MTNKHAKLFDAFQIGTKTLRNRIAVAPMTRVSGEEDGEVIAEHIRRFLANNSIASN